MEGKVGMNGKSIKKILFFKSRIMVYALIILLIPINFTFYLSSFHKQQKERSEQMFHQIMQVIKMNENDINAERDEFSEFCIQKAKMVAYFVAHEPNTRYDLESIKELASVMVVDEIHFFNKEGEIYTGSHPEYYGYTVYSGEQIGFFEQMLDDTNLALCQDILPNTAEGKEMQYAAVWLEDKSGFVQIGMRPERLLNLIEEKSLQNIIKSIPFEKREYFHVIDIDKGNVIASSVDQMVGKDFSDSIHSLEREKCIDTVQMHRTFGESRYCVYIRLFEKYLLVHSYDSQYLLTNTISSSVILLASILLTTICIIGVFLSYVKHHIVENVFALNEELKKIELGDLESLEVDTKILEFNVLTYYINQLLQSIRFDNKRMQDIINCGQISLGIFEYNSFYKKIFLNQQMKHILGIEISLPITYDAEKNMILGKLNEIEQNCVDPVQDIYEYNKGGEILYVHLKKYSDEQNVIYYLDDISLWWNKINLIKDDSFKDVLTGLLNRRGIQENAKQIFGNQEVIKEAAVILLDADGLKRINDLYGHPTGDEYLRKIAAILSGFPQENILSARLGGDEFVVIIYGFDKKEEVDHVINELISKRGSIFDAPQLLGYEEKLEFSVGYSYFPSEGKTYQELMSLADERMYQEKRERKSQMNFCD